MSEWALRMQKNSFSALVNAALAGKPQTVTRRGTPVVVVAAKDYNRLCQAKKDSAPTFVDHLLTFLQGDEEFERMPLETRPLDLFDHVPAGHGWGFPPTQTNRHPVACQWLESRRQADLHLGIVTLAERARGIARQR